MLRGIWAAAIAATIGLFSAPASATVYSTSAMVDLFAFYRADGTTFAESISVPEAVNTLDADGRNYELVALLRLSDYALDMPPLGQNATWTLSATVSGGGTYTPVGGTETMFNFPTLGGVLTTFESTTDDVVNDLMTLAFILSQSLPGSGYQDGVGGYVTVGDFDGDLATFDPGLVGGLLEADDFFVFLNEGLGLTIDNPLGFLSSANLNLNIELSLVADDGIAAVPEPAALGLLGAGLVGIAFMRRRKA
ncbi:PEP-CTERM sorting domain-containing protein [Pedomonas mirosovicensis]|uniref:PEP-CTERM sorting domain-containing protein n=1 Tax=Pedomonas mirosovicensis TaxID=2908641 RepID=UPI00216A3ECE|nr:PEP-CTERM sorting domain-containing protein [Pedomonas mirosovicensis]MCH8684954.1 PEP-CTERM sorting domain-containing protein [Pedomonas mirosovicensis]